LQLTTFGRALKAAREAANLSSDQAARRLDLNPSNYSAWENDRRTPDEKRQREALALLRATSPAAHLAALLAQYQREQIALSAKFAARLLLAVSEEDYGGVAGYLESVSPVPQDGTTEVILSGDRLIEDSYYTSRRGINPAIDALVEQYFANVAKTDGVTGATSAAPAKGAEEKADAHREIVQQTGPALVVSNPPKPAKGRRPAQ
jgi:transcriptional regulator with XRE-family HTH domain